MLMSMTRQLLSFEYTMEAKNHQQHLSIQLISLALLEESFYRLSYPPGGGASHQAESTWKMRHGPIERSSCLEQNCNHISRIQA